MRPIRMGLLVAAAILGLTVLAPSATASSTTHELHITKDCSTNTGIAPTYCTVAASNLKAIHVKVKIWYLGPILTNAYFISSNIKIDAWHGNTATGYCMYDGVESSGICTFWKGTGTLAKFRAVVHVTIDSKGLWHWDGIYYFAGES